jgi:Neprosin
MRKRSRVRALLVAFSAVAAVALSLPATASASARPAGERVLPTIPPSASRVHSDAATCYFGSCYDYVSGQQSSNVTGVSVDMMQADPELDPNYNGHSLQEISLQDSAQQQTVEIGWTVDRGLNGDTAPHLFVYHWVNGQGTCYNGCGFVQVSTANAPGMTVATGQSAQYGILFYQGNWWVQYNNDWVGYFPGSLWNNAYTSAQLISAFGEVAESGSPSCTDMGNGAFGTAGNSSWISDYQLQGTSDAPDLSLNATTPADYGYGQTSPTSYHLGGPGGSAC